MTLASSAAKVGVALSQAGPPPVGRRNKEARFQVFRCTAGPVIGLPAAVSVSDAQSSNSRMPAARAQCERSSSCLVSSSGPVSVA